MNNFILLYGEALDYPQQVSVDKKGKAYYKFNAAVERESGIIDILPIVVVIYTFISYHVEEKMSTIN